MCLFGKGVGMLWGAYITGTVLQTQGASMQVHQCSLHLAAAA